MTLNKILEQEKLLDFEKYNFGTKIITDDVVGVAFCALKKYSETNKNTAILAQNLFIAEQIRDILIDFVGAENVIYLPSEELVESEFLAASPDIKCDRIGGLVDLLSAEHKIIIMNVATALRYYPDPKLFASRIIKINKNDTINFSEFKAKTLQNGYIFQSKVEKTGDFSFRGDIFDIFPFGAKDPIRIEFFDDEIESIRNFKIENQESYGDLNEVVINPATELMLTESEFNNLENKFLNALNEEKTNTDLRKNILDDVERMKINLNNYGLYKYFSFIQDRNYSIFDYFKAESLIISNYDLCYTELNKLVEDGYNFIVKLKENNKIIKDLQIFYETFKYTTSVKEEIINGATLENAKRINIKTPFLSSNSIEASLNSIKKYGELGYKIYIFFDNEQQLNFYKTSLLLEKNTSFAEILNVETIVSHLSSGFDFTDKKVLFLTSKEIFGVNYSKSKYTSKFKNAQVIRSFEELKVGDFVVHEKYGIALYQGIKRMKANNIENDYMSLQYEGADHLYVPLEHFKYIRKYVGREGFTPKLSKLYSSKWETTKKKVLDKLDFLAEKLSILYRERETIKGFAFQPDDVFQIDFERKFPYELTSDQQKAVEDIKKDMESPLPMDRLICGDVGFGKTEVAFRAAFKCINNGKQVLLLCPTTLLAKQHYQRALERFSGFGVKIACLTRFTTTKEFNSDVKDIKAGKIHFVIGTHKALSKNIDFNDIGLLIIDEEQRFGVEHKETITMKNKTIDVLTLSATPIPRTLQQSLVGMKSISIINTAPQDRNPIQTYLIEHNDQTIYELVARELGRNGQVYYVHNDVSTIFDVKNKILENVRGSKVEIVHGKMKKSEIEEVMNKFYAGEVQVLIATTIVENGIDVARANLIIIEQADRFGLAQLYQLKGRVGRSNRLAYAFLTYNPRKVLDEVAEKRLKSIQEFTELGSGYKIAQRDLMIRGAGDILGSEQAGFIDDVGIDLYLKLLNDAIAKKEGKQTDREIEYKKISADGYIPDMYATESNKFEIYKWIDSCKNIEELQRIWSKIKDIYGKIPSELNNVLKLRKIKIILLKEEFSDFTEDKNSFTIYLNDNFTRFDGIGSKLFIKLMGYNKDVLIKTVNKNIKIVITKGDNYLDLIYSVLSNIDNLYDSYIKNEIR